MELQTLTAKTREAGSKGETRRLRVQGFVPGVLYGGGSDPVNIELEAKPFEILLHAKSGEHAVVQLVVTDRPELSTPALLKEVQHHPLRGQATHADLMRIRLDQRIETTVPVVVTGRPVGVIEGGVLDQQLRALAVECLAVEVPEQIVIDVTHLKLGESVHVRDLAVPENVTVLMDPDRPVAAVQAPRVLREGEGEGAAAEGAEPATPEVIGKRKEKEEEE